MDTVSVRVSYKKITPQRTISSKDPTLQSKSPQISLRRRLGRVDNMRAFRVASRSPASVRNPAKSECLDTASARQADVCALCDVVRDWRRGLRGGTRVRRTPLAGYRRLQIMMSKVDQTNVLYYVVNVPNNAMLQRQSLIPSRFVTDPSFPTMINIVINLSITPRIPSI
ncbi:unnamed protein product [Colias eurytheme]|nr:unnamed protein product [Colias eurytheme]